MQESWEFRRTCVIAEEEATDAGGESEAEYEGLLWRQVEQVPELGALCFVDTTFHAARIKILKNCSKRHQEQSSLGRCLNFGVLHAMYGI